MTATEIQQDEIYAEAFAKAEKAFNKKYKKLLDAAKNWMAVYDDAYGEPEKCPEYFKLKMIIESGE